MSKSLSDAAALTNVTDLASEEGWESNGALIFCDGPVLRDFGFEDESPRWEARRLLTQCIAAIRGYCGSAQWDAMGESPGGGAHKRHYVLFRHFIREEGFTPVMRSVLITQLKLPVVHERGHGVAWSYVISYADCGPWAEAGMATRAAATPAPIG